MGHSSIRIKTKRKKPNSSDGTAAIKGRGKGATTVQFQSMTSKVRNKYADKAAQLLKQ